MAEYELNFDRLRVVGDSASNNTSAVKLLNCSWQPCLAHKLNTVVTTALNNNVSSLEVLKNCRKIYKFLLFKKKDMDDAAIEEENQRINEKEMAEENEIVEEISQHFELNSLPCGGEQESNVTQTENVIQSKAKRIKIDVQTRWNSTYLMLKSMLDLETRITTVLIKHKKRDLIFKDDELSLMRKLMVILKPFYDATLTASESIKELTVVRTVFQLINLYDFLEDLTVKEPDQKVVMLLVSLKTNLIQKIDITDEMLVSVLLDPFMKDADLFKSYLQKYKIDSFELLSRVLEKYHLCDSQLAEQEQAASVPEDESWRTLFRKPSASSENVTLSIRAYIEKDFPASTIAKHYWKMNPGVLSKPVKIVFSMIFSSVSAERTFSCAGNTITGKRNSISPTNVKKM